jgi:hypothetical protein
MQRIPQVVARQRAHLGGLVERVTHLDGAHVFDKSLLELAPHLLDDDKTLSRNATLAGIHQAALGADIGRDLDIRVLENDVGVTPAKFQNGLLEHRTGLAGDRALRKRVVTNLDQGLVTRAGRHQNRRQPQPMAIRVRSKPM